MIQGHNKHVYIFFKTIFREQCSFDDTERTTNSGIKLCKIHVDLLGIRRPIGLNKGLLSY